MVGQVVLLLNIVLVCHVHWQIKLCSTAAEVESVMNSVLEVHTAAAIVQDAGKTSAALIGYVEPASVSAEAVMAACRAKLSSYMVPSAVVCLEVMPRLSNGKVRYRPEKRWVH